MEGDRIRIAPKLAERLERARFRKIGLERLLASVSKFVADEMTAAAKEEDLFWRDVYSDIGLDYDQIWSYEYMDGSIRNAGPRPGLQRDDGGEGKGARKGGVRGL